MAYPLSDLLIISILLGVFALTGWRPGRDWLIIAVAFACFAVLDTIYLHQVASGTYQTGTLIDVAERQRAEREHEFLQAMLESLDTGIVACGPGGVLSLFNSATREMHGILEESLLPRPGRDAMTSSCPTGRRRWRPTTFRCSARCRASACRELEPSTTSSSSTSASGATAATSCS